MAADYEAGKGSGTYMSRRKEWTADIREEAPWLLDTPAHTVYGAMIDAGIAYSGMLRQRAKGGAAELPRCRKRKQTSFYILGNRISDKGIYPRLLGCLRSAEPLPVKPPDSRITFECGRWYLCVPQKVAVTHSDSQGVCAVDPGVRTFATVFSQSGIHAVGQGAFGRIARLSKHLDDLFSRATKEPSRRRRRMRQAAARALRKIRRLVDDMHYQFLGWVFRNYQTVVFPEADFTSACRKLRRKIGRESVRSLLTWSFARLRNRLVAKAQAMGRNVLIVDEAYTSKTANWTGEIVHDLGRRKVIRSQGRSMDRDVNGALGIMLKALVNHPIACYRCC